MVRIKPWEKFLKGEYNFARFEWVGEEPNRYAIITFGKHKEKHHKIKVKMDKDKLKFVEEVKT